MSPPEVMQDPESFGQIKEKIWDYLESKQWKGHDPFDGLLSRKVRPKSRWGQLILLQLVKRSPWDLHHILDIPEQENPMSWGAGILGVCSTTPLTESKKEWLANANRHLLRLAHLESGLWGYPFPWQALAFYVPKGHPNIVMSAFAIRSLSESFSHLSKNQQTEVFTHLERSISTLQKLFYKEEGFFSYVDHKSVLVHNANLFGVEAILRGIAIGIGTWQDCDAKIRKALEHTLDQQASSGRWTYGMAGHHQWCDNFHTAYNLISLLKIRKILQCHSKDTDVLIQKIEISIRKGWIFFQQTAATVNGRAKYYDRKTWPVEAHSTAAALVLCHKIVADGFGKKKEALDLGERMLKKTLADLYLGEGRFAYRKWPTHRVNTVYTRWTQSWMYYGLESLEALRSQ